MEQEDDKPLLSDQSFLGTGWSFPPEFSGAVRSISTVSDNEDIRKSLEILLGTQPGERVMQPEFGCDLSSLSFEPITTTLSAYIHDIIKTSILFYEPRISVENVTMEADEAVEGKIIISIDYLIRKNNTRSNFVYPFYVQEATIGNP